MTNSLTVALTLAAPRLWVLVRALTFWLKDQYQCWRIRRHRGNTGQDRHYGDIPLVDLLEHSLTLTTHSHSELSAARSVILDTFRNMQGGRIALASNPERAHQSGPPNSRTNFRRRLRRVTDIVFPILFSAILVGLFVAQTTGTILSANIFSDEMAQIESSNCSVLFPNIVKGWDHTYYYEKCYRTSEIRPECSEYSNRTIGYTEQQSQKVCPFRGNVCSGNSISFDTGDLDAQVLGINTQEKYHIKKKTTCAQLRIQNNSTYEASVDIISRLLPAAFKVCDGSPVSYGREITQNWSHAYIGYTQWYKTCQSIIDPGFTTKESRDASIVIIRALTLQEYGDLADFDSLSEHLSPTPIISACVGEARFCDSKGLCSYVTPLEYVSGAYGKYGWDHIAAFRDSASFKHETKPARILLSAVLTGNVVSDPSHWFFPDSNQCFNGSCTILHSSWAESLRQNWEKSLAIMQTHVISIMRGDHNDGGSVEITKDLRDICGLGKYRSIGWRNVSCWGLIGLLALALLVSIGSISTDDEVLWAAFVLRILWKYLVVVSTWLRRLPYLVIDNLYSFLDIWRNKRFR